MQEVVVPVLNQGASRQLCVQRWGGAPHRQQRRKDPTQGSLLAKETMGCEAELLPPPQFVGS